jgi:hypothetical protein
MQLKGRMIRGSDRDPDPMAGAKHPGGRLEVDDQLQDLAIGEGLVPVMAPFVAMPGELRFDIDVPVMLGHDRVVVEEECVFSPQLPLGHQEHPVLRIDVLEVHKKIAIVGA